MYVNPNLQTYILSKKNLLEYSFFTMFPFISPIQHDLIYKVEIEI